MKIAVIDTGLGIKEENIANLFQAFGKIKQDNSAINSYGIGFGLMISNELVKSLNDDQEE